MSLYSKYPIMEQLYRATLPPSKNVGNKMSSSKNIYSQTDYSASSECPQFGTCFIGMRLKRKTMMARDPLIILRHWSELYGCAIVVRCVFGPFMRCAGYVKVYPLHVTVETLTPSFYSRKTLNDIHNSMV